MVHGFLIHCKLIHKMYIHVWNTKYVPFSYVKDGQYTIMNHQYVTWHKIFGEVRFSGRKERFSIKSAYYVLANQK